MVINYKYLEDYIISINSLYRVMDFKKILEDLICYLDYFPKEEIPEYYRQFDIEIKDCKKLIVLCNRKINEINSRVGE